jgi:lipopolysaccharide export LptBFGC system permease protein LptF
LVFDILSTMSWWSIAAELVKGAMNASQARPQKPSSEPPPDGLNLAELLQRYREEVDQGFEGLSQTIHEQKQRYERALRTQRRWNYGLLVGVVAVAVLALVLYARTA